MPQSSYAASVQGVSIRVTRLDFQGNLLGGDFDSYTTDAFIRTSFTPEYEDGDEITEKGADGNLCVSYKAPSTLKRVNMEIAICDPDPELTNLLSGGLLLSGQDMDSNEVSLGWASAKVGEDPAGNGVAVEVWSKAIINGKPAQENPYYHWVFPYVRARLSGDRVIENGLLATTFEGYGEGNINFRSGPDQSWRWPAAADRPYLYAREAWAPQGLRGFYTWIPAETPGGETTSVDSPDTFTNVIGTNTMHGNEPYQYNPHLPLDAVLSTVDYVDDDSGTLTYPASADDGSVKNIPTDTGVQVDNPVTYNKRISPIAAAPGAVFSAEPTITASDAPNAAKLAGLGYVADPLTEWTSGQKITIGIYTFNWSGTAWAAGAHGA